jgi:uncharacterized membrane protein
MKSSTSERRVWRGGVARYVPADAVLVVALVGLANAAVLVSPLRETAVRPLVAIPLSFFLPGYAVVAALFPRRGEVESRPAGEATGRRIDWVERLGLSFGASLAVLPLVGLAYASVTWPASPAGVAAALGAVAVAGMAIATVRRWQLPPESRFRLPTRRWIDGIRGSLGGTPIGALSSVLLAAAVVLAVGGLGYAVAVPNDGSSYTGATLLTEQGGEFVASDYPTDLESGDPAELVLSLENAEGESMEYTVVVALERTSDDGGETEVVEREELDRFSVSVDAGETTFERHEFTPGTAGEDLRLSYYVYVGDPPAEPSPENAYRHLFLWVDVSPS